MPTSPSPLSDRAIAQSTPNARKGALASLASLAARAWQGLTRDPTEELRSITQPSPLAMAILADNLDLVKKLATPEACAGVDWDGRTPLMAAIVHERLACAKAIAPLSDMDREDPAGLCALSLAARLDAVDIAKMLIPLADPARRSAATGRTALMEAAMSGAERAVRLLADKGGARLVDQETGQCALEMAIERWREESSIALAPHSDCDRAGNLGRTPLLQAAAKGQSDTIIALLPLSDAKRADDEGRTALMLAAKMNAARGVIALLPRSDPQARDAAGKTALMLAAASGSLACVQELLGVSDPFAADSQGFSALAWALDSARDDLPEDRQRHPTTARVYETIDLLAAFATKKEALALREWLAKEPAMAWPRARAWAEAWELREALLAGSEAANGAASSPASESGASDFAANAQPARRKPRSL